MTEGTRVSSADQPDAGDDPNDPTDSTDPEALGPDPDPAELTPTDPTPAETGPADAGARDPATERGGLLGSSAVMAAGTLVSRITGFVRNLFLVWALGATLFADSFNLANSIPTAIYILVAGGALNAVFVPQLVRAMKQDDDGGHAFGNRLLTATALLLGGLTVVAVVAAPLLVRAYASPKLVEKPAYFDLAVTYAHYCLPQIFFFGVFVILGQILNARGNFGPMMWAPILNNLINIAVFATFIVISEAHSPDTITGGEKLLLGLGTTVGIAIQALVLIPVLRRTGFRIRPRFDFRGGGLGKSGRLAIWTVGFVIVNQIWFLIASKLTTDVAAQALDLPGRPGYGLTPYQEAFLIFQLPHAVIAVSLVTALLPQMSRAAADGRTRELRDSLSHGLRMISVAILPATAAFLALGPVMSLALFGWGNMSPSNARFIGFVLMGFAPGLLGFCSHYTVLRGFYAYEDTRTPVFIQLVVLTTSSATALIAFATLPLAWKTVGISAAYGIGYWAGFAVSQAVLRRRIGGLDGRRILHTYSRAGAAALLAGVMAYAAGWSLQTLLGPTPGAALIAAGVGGMILLAAYVLIGRLFAVRELTEIIGMVRGRLGR